MEDTHTGAEADTSEVKDKLTPTAKAKHAITPATAEDTLDPLEEDELTAEAVEDIFNPELEYKLA